MGFLFAFQGEGGHEREGGAAFEFRFAGCPLTHLGEGEIGFAKYVDAHLIADVPRIEFGDPRVGELGGELLGIGS